MRLKNILPVFVVLLFLGVASTAFAQVSCSVASTPVSRDTTTGLTEPAGDITFTCTQTGAASTAATITVDYQGAQITNCQRGGSQNATCGVVGPPGGYPTAKPIDITPVAGAGCAQPTIGPTGVSNTTGQIVISVPAEAPGAGLSCSFTLTGVLFAFAGTGKTSDTASVSVSPGNGLLITAGQNNPTIVTSVLDAVAATAFKAAAPAVVLTTGAVITSAASMTLVENYIDAFRSLAQFNTGAATQGVQFNITFAGLVTGESMTCVAPTANNSNTVTVTPATGVATSAAPTLTIEWTSAGVTGLTTIDTLTIPCVFAVGGATTPLAAGSVTATMTLAPAGTAFGAGNAVLTSATAGQIPRYAGPTLGPVTVATIIAATTHMLFPFVTTGNGFDTGLAFANTGTDPYGTKGQGGPVSVVFYPQSGGTPFCVSTAAGAAGTTGGTTVSGITAGCTVMATVPGSGITGGALAAGSTWAVNASDLLKAAGAAAVFNGYAFAISNSPVNHGSFFVYLASGGNFAGFSGGPALVVPNPSVPANCPGGTTFCVGPRNLLFEGLAH